MVVVARFSFPYEAHIAKANLASAGIESFIADEHTVNAQWLYSDALGGVRLMVAEEDANQASEILGEDFSQCFENADDAVEGHIDVCPHCGSSDIAAYTKGKRSAFLVFILLGLPLFFYQQGYMCNQCGAFSKTL